MDITPEAVFKAFAPDLTSSEWRNREWIERRNFQRQVGTGGILHYQCDSLVGTGDSPQFSYEKHLIYRYRIAGYTVNLFLSKGRRPENENSVLNIEIGEMSEYSTIRVLLKVTRTTIPEDNWLPKGFQYRMIADPDVATLVMVKARLYE